MTFLPVRWDQTMMGRDDLMAKAYRQHRGGYFVSCGGTAHVPPGLMFELPLEWLAPEIREWLVEQRCSAIFEAHWTGLDDEFLIELWGGHDVLFKLTWGGE